jgi:hypothetical protein
VPPGFHNAPIAASPGDGAFRSYNLRPRQPQRTLPSFDLRHSRKMTADGSLVGAYMLIAAQLFSSANATTLSPLQPT